MKVIVIPIEDGVLGKKAGRIKDKKLVAWLVGFYGISTFVGLYNAKSIFMQIVLFILG